MLVSGFVALTLSPMMCSKLLKHEEKHGRVFTMIEAGSTPDQRLCAFARVAARAALDRRTRLVRHGRTRAVSLAAALSSCAAGGPRRHLRPHAVSARATVDYTSEQLRPVEQFFRRFPEAAAYNAIAGFRRSTSALASCG